MSAGEISSGSTEWVSAANCLAAAWVGSRPSPAAASMGPVGAVSEPHHALGGVLAGDAFGVAFAAPNPTAVFG